MHEAKDQPNKSTQEVAEILYEYLSERSQPGRISFASKFASRSLASKLQVSEQTVLEAIERLHDDRRIVIKKTTNNLRTYISH